MAELIVNPLLNQSPRSSNQVCLITHEPLKRNSINLTCGHTYNYVPLCKELIIQRSRSSRLTCPYCSQHINKFIPYVPNLYRDEFKRIVRKSNCIDLRQCDYVYKRGAKKGMKCTCKSGYETEYGSFCYQHDKHR